MGTLDMNRKILALLFTVALTCSTGAAQACSMNRRDAPASGVLAAANNPVLPPVAEQTNGVAASSIASWTHKIKTFLDRRFIEESCLTTAVYFEARSESQLGQLAVATVILNRVKASTSSSSICRVVYKGASHLNACQFSFACDGKPDVVDDSRAWKMAVAITAMALADDRTVKDGPMQILATATNYHADYVDPAWSKSLNRLTKIGRHIFYSQS
jgi:spore germination cell wall hydrolase CwlJ-like protein